MEQQNTIVEELQALFNNKLEKSPYLTISSLETSKLSRKTIERLLKGETKNPSASTVIESLKVTCKGKSIREIYESLKEGDLKDYVLKILKYNKIADVAQDCEMISNDFESYLMNPVFVDLLSYVITKESCSKSDIIKMFGISGNEKLNYLIKENILNDSMGSISANMISLSEKSTKFLISYFAKNHLSTENYDSFEDINWHFFIAKSINKNKVMKEVLDISRRASRAVYKIVHDPANAGNDLFYWSSFSDIFLSKKELEQ